MEEENNIKQDEKPKNKKPDTLIVVIFCIFCLSLIAEIVLLCLTLWRPALLVAPVPVTTLTLLIINKAVFGKHK